MSDEISYRSCRPEVKPAELAAWVHAQGRSVVVHRQDLDSLKATGAVNAVALPTGGPLRGEVWLPI